MKAIVQQEPGDESTLQLGEADAPPQSSTSLRIRVRASGINRADLLQRQGLYPPPPGASEILGLECAGEVIEVGEAVSGWSTGDRAMALLGGGGYAEEVVVDSGSAMHVPESFSWPEAAAFPEVYLTVFLNVFQLAALPEGGSVLVHGGGSGIGTATIQLAKAAGAACYATAGSPEKCERCETLGAVRAINYKKESFAEVLAGLTGGEGVDVILDSIGASYLTDNLNSLALGGRLVVIGLMGGAKAEISLATLLTRRLQVIGSTLRARPAAQKAAIVSGLLERFGDAIEAGELRPVVDHVYAPDGFADAHERMQASEHFGKLVVEWPD